MTYPHASPCRQYSRHRLRWYPQSCVIEQETPNIMIDLKGKVAVVFGLANKRSIAWGIAQKLSEAGARLAICYQSERLKKEAEALIPELKDAQIFQCDVSSDAEIDAVFEQLKTTYGKIDILVHSVAFAPADAIKNDFV